MIDQRQRLDELEVKMAEIRSRGPLVSLPDNLKSDYLALAHSADIRRRGYQPLFWQVEQENRILAR